MSEIATPKRKTKEMFSAISFVNRAKENTIFEICIDNEWHYDLNREKAISLIVDYEIKMTADTSEIIDEPWHADVMEFWPSKCEDNTIELIIL